MAHEKAVMPANDAPPVAAAPPAHVQLTTDAPKNWRPVITIGFIILLGFFGGFGGWAAYAPLGTGAIAVGQVQVAGKQKMVQSKDGGIIAALHVRDGDVVSTGQVLLELDSTETQVEVSVLSSQLWALQARMARLEAERLHQLVQQERWWEALDSHNRLDHPWWQAQTQPQRRTVEQAIARIGDSHEHHQHGDARSEVISGAELDRAVQQQLHLGLEPWQAFEAGCRALGGQVEEDGPESFCRRRDPTGA